MRIQDNQNKKKLEEITVILSPLEETLTKVPLFGEVYSTILQRKYKKFLPNYKIKLY